MVLITPEQEIARLEGDLEDVRDILGEFEETLRDLRKRVRAGEVDNLKDASKTLTELRSWLKLAKETEAQLAEYARKEAGIVGSWGLDLDRARSEVGGRLARVRACCGARGVSG